MFEESCSNYSECLDNSKSKRNKQKKRLSRYFVEARPHEQDGGFKEKIDGSNRQKGRGRWTMNEQKAYINFLRENMEEMREKVSRKSQKVFLKMSRKIRSRNADQCRSHHQKILKYHNSLEETIKFFQEDVFDKKDADKSKASDEVSFTKDNFYHMQILPNNIIRIVINEKAIGTYPL